MRKGGTLTNITARPLSNDQLTSMLRGTGLAELIPEVDGEGPLGEISAGRRRATAQVARRGGDIVVSLTRLEGAPVTAGGTQALHRVPPTAAPSAPARTKDPTTPRTKEPSAPPRTKEPSAAPPRAKEPTASPATKMPETRFSVPRAQTAPVSGSLRPPARPVTAPPPAASIATFSLEDELELSAPTPIEAAKTTAMSTAYRDDDSISLGALDSPNFELDYGPATPAAPAAPALPPAAPPAQTSRIGVAFKQSPVAMAATQQLEAIDESALGLELDTGPLPQEIAHAGTAPIDVPLHVHMEHAAFGTLVRAARDVGASDLHIAAARQVSIRVNGELVPIESRSNPLSAQAAEELLLPLLDDSQKQQLKTVGYVDLALEAPGGGRLRANISRQQQGLKGTFRLALAAPATLEQLGLPTDLAKVVSHHQGLVVIAGPSGHGKTTTLAALVDLLNSTKPYHILTIEDPVEIVHPRKQAVISQRESGRHTQSFARGLKASLREDPDVIVIGELRDRESVEIALTAAETGHLVLATMSTPSAAKTIDRLIDMFPPEEHSQVRASIAGALRAIVAQRLLPRRGGGIVPAIELVTGVLPLAVLIRDDKLFQLPSLMQRGRAFGMIRFDESLLEHVRTGRIDEETALAVAESKKDLAANLRAGAPAAQQPAPPKTSQLWGFGKKGGDR